MKNLMKYKTGLTMKLNRDNFQEYIAVFLNENAKLNLISKNDEKFLWEKHICDSLAISVFFEKYGLPENLLDIGTGGGFPAVPVAMAYSDIEVYALDSIRKKINAIENIKTALNLKNLHPICSRAEHLTGKYGTITSRAVAPLKVLAEYALPLLDAGGYFVAYKSLKVNEELEEAQQRLKKSRLKLEEIIEYDLPLEENYSRNLVILKKY